MEFKVFKNETGKILKEYWLTPSEWEALDKTTVQEGDIYHIVGTIDKGDLSADVNASLAKGDSSLQKPTATLAKESFVKVGMDGTQKFDESSYASLDADKTNTFYSANTFNRPVKLAKDTSYVEYGEQSSYKFRDNSKENAVATLNDLIEDDTKTYITFKGIKFPSNTSVGYSFDVQAGCTIDWGDGSIQSFADATYNITHTYSEANSYRIAISGLTEFSNGALDGCSEILDVKLSNATTYIGGSACRGTSISHITIPASVTDIQLGTIFANCAKLKTVRVLSATPLTTATDIFENSPIEKIIVPKAAINAYKAAVGWIAYADKIVYEVDSTDISDTSNFAKLSGNNTFSGSNTFTGMTYLKNSLVCQDEVSGLAAGFNHTGMTLETAGSSNTLNISVNNISHKVLDSNKSAVANTTLTFPTSTNGIATTVTLPNKTGTLALTSDLPVVEANPVASGTTSLIRLKVGNTIYSIPSGSGSGDVTSSGTNIFTGDNTFKGKVIIGTEPTSGQQTSPLPYTKLLNNSISIVNEVDATAAKIEPTQFYVNMGMGLSATYTGNKIIYSNGGVNLTLNFPTNNGVTDATETLATLSDIPIKSASLDGTTLNITLA